MDVQDQRRPDFVCQPSQVLIVPSLSSQTPKTFFFSFPFPSSRAREGRGGRVDKGGGTYRRDSIEHTRTDFLLPLALSTWTLARVEVFSELG